MDTTRTEFITKLSTTAEAMRQFGNFADALAKVVAKAPLDDPEVIETLQAAIDAIPATSRKRKLTTLGGTEEAGKRRKREKKPKDPNAPKAPPSAYILFQNDIRNAVREENPNIQYRELMGLISQQWSGLPSEKKQPYFDRVTVAKQTHEEELAKYNAANLNHAPMEGTSKTVKKEVLPAAKPEKKVISVPAKPTPKSAEVASSDNEQSDGSDDVSSVGDKQGDEKATDDGSSEEESDKEPTPPPAKKAKKADGKRK
ncbi:high mobility group box domain-containing protein [Chiua virens]|nr:high mobility group box domain-containing protein [Chiua virens]